MKQLIFHAGFPKTGSTSLQYFLNDNKRNFINWGYYFDDMVNENNFVNYEIIWRCFFVDLYEKYFNHNPSFSNLRQYLVEQIEKADKHNCDKIIISSEGLSEIGFIFAIYKLPETALDTQFLLKLQKETYEELHKIATQLGLKIKIVCYARCSVERSLSYYNTVVKCLYETKLAYDFDLKNFIERWSPWFDNYIISRMFRDTFGEEGTQIRIYKNYEKDWDIRQDFFENVLFLNGYANCKFDQTDVSNNISIGYVNNRAKRVLNKVKNLDDEQINSLEIQSVQHTLYNSFPNEISFIDSIEASYKEYLRNLYSESNHKLVEEFSLPDGQKWLDYINSKKYTQKQQDINETIDGMLIVISTFLNSSILKQKSDIIAIREQLNPIALFDDRLAHNSNRVDILKQHIDALEQSLIVQINKNTILERNLSEQINKIASLERILLEHINNTPGIQE